MAKTTPASLEALCRDIGGTIRTAVEEAGKGAGVPLGFAFFLVDVGDRGSMAYMASVERHGVIALLDELRGKLIAETRPVPAIKVNAAVLDGEPCVLMSVGASGPMRFTPDQAAGVIRMFSGAIRALADFHADQVG
jgi:hypothetical protein